MFHLKHHTIAFAPGLLDIQDEDKLVDVFGRSCNIEVRGTRQMDNLWFNAQDCANALDFKDVLQRLGDIESSYQDGTHYQYFRIEGEVYAELFLSFLGVSSMFFDEKKLRNPMAHIFDCWVMDNLVAEPKQSIIQLCCV